jgi:hypothetical protein
MIESLAPDTVAIPIRVMDDTWSDDDITDFYWAMRRLGEEYADAMKWVGNDL